MGKQVLLISLGVEDWQTVGDSGRIIIVELVNDDIEVLIVELEDDVAVLELSLLLVVVLSLSDDAGVKILLLVVDASLTDREIMFVGSSIKEDSLVRVDDEVETAEILLVDIIIPELEFVIVVESGLEFVVIELEIEAVLVESEVKIVVVESETELVIIESETELAFVI